MESGCKGGSGWEQGCQSLGVDGVEVVEIQLTFEDLVNEFEGGSMPVHTESPCSAWSVVYRPLLNHPGCRISRAVPWLLLPQNKQACTCVQMTCAHEYWCVGPTARNRIASPFWGVSPCLPQTFPGVRSCKQLGAWVSSCVLRFHRTPSGKAVVCLPGSGS